MVSKISIKFGGASGQGINATGKIFTKVVSSLGLNTFSYREYPSLIKGGVASYQIDFSNTSINSSSRYTNILSVLSVESFHSYLKDVSKHGIAIFDGDSIELTEEEQKFVKKNDIKVIAFNSQKLAVDSGGTPIMANIVLLGFVWKIFGQDIKVLNKEVIDFFIKKNLDEKIEKACIKAGYDSPLYKKEYGSFLQFPKAKCKDKNKNLSMTGNDAIALGAIASGVRAFYGYPMTPATSIYNFLGSHASETGMLIKQAENEITAVQMCLGSMYMGTRALTATSGGGFDLMVETVSCAGVSETPLVIVMAQRAGAGTGVPTWTGAGDILTTVNAGHGEFPKCVLAVSDLRSCFLLTCKAYELADKYQMPVIILTEKQIAEAIFSTRNFPTPPRVNRYLQKGKERYEITKNGISPRWLPNKSSKPYLHSTDEHLENGESTEDAEAIVKMYKKRQKKMEMLERELPEPVYYGARNAKTVFVGCGSTKNVMLDCIAQNKEIAYLHYEYIYPLKTKAFETLAHSGRRLVLVENNQTGQLGELITQKTGYKFKEKLLKYDGRPFFVEDILDFMEK